MNAPAPARQGPSNWMVLLTVIIGTFLGRLDQTIVNLALPKMIDDFHITVTSAGWIATAYILANAVFVPVWGKLGDTIGRKKVYIAGFALFIVGSVLAGLAWNLPSMILFRVIQAVAGSADYPTAMAILATTFREEKPRAQALGIWSASFAAAAVFGPLIGGPLIDGFGWRAVFMVNLPVGLVGLLMALHYIQESVSEKRTHKFDVFGAFALGVALSAIVLVLDKGIDWGWTSGQSMTAYAVAIIAGVLFYWQEKRHPEPVVDLRFFRNNILVQTVANNFIVFMGMMGSVFLIPVFAQTFLGMDATQSGLLFVPMAFSLMLGAPIGGRLTGKVQPRYVIFVSTLIAGIALYFFTRVDARSTSIDIMLPLSFMAFGIGLGMAQRTNVVAAAVPASEIGIASSILALARNIAGAFGVAISATLLKNVTEGNVLRITKLSTLHSTLPADYAKFVALIGLKAQIDAYGTVFFISSVLITIGAFLILFMPNVKLDPKVTVHVE